MNLGRQSDDMAEILQVGVYESLQAICDVTLCLDRFAHAQKVISCF